MEVFADIAPQPRVYIETYGCQMNVADSQTVRAVMRQAGFQNADHAEDADVILLNTCAIREHAEERVLKRLSELAGLKRRRPGVRLGLLGCMAQHNRASIVEKAPWLDLVAGPDSYRRLPELIGRAGFDSAVDVALDRAETYADIAPEHQDGVRRYVTAMRGCDKFCAFCVVPYVRGRERSVPAEAVIREVAALAARGVKEVVLLGQTVNAYRFGEIDFRRIAADGRCGRRYRADPLYFAASGRHERIGDRGDGVRAQGAAATSICRCNRARTGSWPRWIVATPLNTTSTWCRGSAKRFPALALSTDIIVGFHGEEESDFDSTLALMKAVRYDSAFSFKYSLRAHTRAFKLGDTVNEVEKSRRIAAAIALQEQISAERNRALVGAQFEVLVEGPARRGNGMLAGKTPQFKTAIFPARPEIVSGDTIAVRVESATGHSLTCSLPL